MRDMEAFFGSCVAAISIAIDVCSIRGVPVAGMGRAIVTLDIPGLTCCIEEFVLVQLFDPPG